MFFCVYSCALKGFVPQVMHRIIVKPLINHGLHNKPIYWLQLYYSTLVSASKHLVIRYQKRTIAGKHQELLVISNALRGWDIVLCMHRHIA